MNMKMVRFIAGVTVMLIAISLMTHFAAAQSGTPTATPLPTEILTVTNASGYRTQVMPDIGTFEYPLAFYSVWMAPAAIAPDGGKDIWFPGVIRIQPNDSVIYGNQFDTAYRIQIAMTEAPGELDAALLGNGPLMQYEPEAFEPGDILRLSLNGVPALRIDNLAVGPEGAVTMDIVAVVDGRLIEILVEPVAQVGGSAVDGLEVVGQIIGSIVFERSQ